MQICVVHFNHGLSRAKYFLVKQGFSKHFVILYLQSNVATLPGQFDRGYTNLIIINWCSLLETIVRSCIGSGWHWLDIALANLLAWSKRAGPTTKAIRRAWIWLRSNTGDCWQGGVFKDLRAVKLNLARKFWLMERLRATNSANDTIERVWKRYHNAHFEMRPHSMQQHRGCWHVLFK